MSSSQVCQFRHWFDLVGWRAVPCLRRRPGAHYHVRVQHNPEEHLSELVDVVSKEDTQEAFFATTAHITPSPHPSHPIHPSSSGTPFSASAHFLSLIIRFRSVPLRDLDDDFDGLCFSFDPPSQLQCCYFTWDQGEEEDHELAPRNGGVPQSLDDERGTHPSSLSHRTGKS